MQIDRGKWRFSGPDFLLINYVRAVNENTKTVFPCSPQPTVMT